MGACIGFSLVVTGTDGVNWTKLIQIGKKKIILSLDRGINAKNSAFFGNTFKI